jgi:hypothetical protein
MNPTRSKEPNMQIRIITKSQRCNITYSLELNIYDKGGILKSISVKYISQRRNITTYLK